MATHVYPIERCVEGKDCKAPNQELTPLHKYTVCKEIILIAFAHKNLLTYETYFYSC